MPKLKIEQKQKLIARIQSFNLVIKSIPNISELMIGNKSIDELRNVTIEEILESEAVPAIKKLLKPKY
jgi:hypothetical protein